MAVDISLIRGSLNVLANNAARGPITEEVIALDLEVMLRRPAIAHQVRAALVWAQQQGWTAETVDEWGLPTWKLTAAGIERQRQP